jgi:hypothetical protein
MNMDELARLPKSDPAEIFRCRDGIYAAELLAAAGFASVDYRETAADRSVIRARKPKR